MSSCQSSEYQPCHSKHVYHLITYLQHHRHGCFSLRLYIDSIYTLIETFRALAIHPRWDQNSHWTLSRSGRLIHGKSDEAENAQDTCSGYSSQGGIRKAQW